jgi:crossover junction endodeoxyribonuclease RuvC
MIILGIDPGVATTGYGLIQTGQNGAIRFIDYGCIITKAGGNPSARLKDIYRELMALIRQYKPHEVAIEEIFFYRNAKTAISVGQSRGVVLLAAANSKKRVFQYTPLQVKQMVAGHGLSDKKAIQKTVKKMLGLKEIPKPDDAADALAVAICHALASKNGGKRKA